MGRGAEILRLTQTTSRGHKRGGGDGEIVVAVIGLGRSLSFQVKAESVENADQQFRLREPDCHKAQGYFYAS